MQGLASTSASAPRRVGIGPQQADQHFGDDAAADRTEVEAVGHAARFLEHVEQSGVEDWNP